MRHLFLTLGVVIPKLAARGATKSTSRIKLLLSLYYFVVSRKLFHSLSDFPISFSAFGSSTTYWLRYPMDIAVLREIYLDKEYDLLAVENPRIIIDLGAHFGDTALYYHMRYPHAKIIAVEPSPKNFARLQKHVAHIPSIVPVAVAVGDTNGTVYIEDIASSLGRRVGDMSGQAVRQVTLPTLCQEHGVEVADIIKFDVEGMEYQIFSDPTAVALGQHFIGEVHCDIAGATVADFTRPFGDRPHQIIEISPQRRYIVTIGNCSTTC